jgi:hypothetical protein
VEKLNNQNIFKGLCCEKMKFAVNKEHIVDHEDYVRNYNIRGKKRVYAIAYCPWCGRDLGSQLNHEYYSILRQEYGIYDPETTEADKVPEEFKTDAWWKKRGL